MKRTVFISSTFEDLKEHRRKVWDTLEEYDVNIRGMEKFGARTEKPSKTSLAEVGQSDVYVGIIAYRLGTVDKTTGKFITQLEYEKAYVLYQADKENMEILIYFVDETNSKISPSFIDFSEKHEKLEAFKSILKQNHTIATFVDEDDLAEKLKRDFARLLTKKEPEGKKVNEYDNSRDKICRFMLLPKLYSGKEIKLRLKIKGEPFPASRSVCDAFNLTYGATVGYCIEFILPKIKEKLAEYIFVTENLAETLFKIENKDNVEVYARLLFSENSIAKYEASFVEKTEYYVSASIPNIDFLRSSYDRPTPVTTPAEGSIILLITQICKD